MSVSGPSPLGTLMVQRVEAALGVTGAQQANVATGARPDAVSQPGQPDKVDPTKNPPPKEQEARRSPEQGARGGLAALARNDPEIAKLLAARNAPMTAYTASAPTTLGQAAKTILALLQQFPDARPSVTGRAPLLNQAPGQGGGAAGTQGGAAGTQSGATGSGQAAANPVNHTLDPRAVQAITQRGAGEGGAQAGQANQAGQPGSAAATARANPAATLQSTGFQPSGASSTAAGAAGANSTGGLPAPTGIAGQLAHALSQALQGSGLFYESHLREFAFGQRTLAQVRAEPQAGAGQEARTPGGDAGQARGGAESSAAQSGTQTGNTSAGQTSAGQASSAAQAVQQAGQAAQAAQQAGQAAQASTHLAGSLLGLDPSTHALVRQQLETLANQAFSWQGEAWPGADLDWEVQRREPQENDPDQLDTWATRLKLTLPGLGEIQARLSLAGGQLIMHVVSPQGADVMADHTSLLRERLSLQGLQLSQLTISRDATEDARQET